MGKKNSKKEIFKTDYTQNLFFEKKFINFIDIQPD